MNKSISSGEYPVFSKEMIDWLYSHTQLGNQIESITFNAGEGTLKLLLRANTQTDAAAYVSRIEKFGEFDSIDYTGYQSGYNDAFGYQLLIRLTSAGKGE